MNMMYFGAVPSIEMKNRKSIEKYLNDICKYEALDEEEEVELAYLAQTGNRMAEVMMVNANLRFVVSIARAYVTMMPLEDIIQNGNIGLIEAVRTFDPHKGYRFVTYASALIRNHILIGLRNQDDKCIRSLKQQGFHAINPENVICCYS